MTALALMRNENLTHEAVLLTLIFCWWAWPVGHLLEGVKCGPICVRARIQSLRLTVFHVSGQTQLRPPCPAASCWGTRWCSDTVAMIMMMIVLPWLLLTENTSCPVSLSAELAIYFPRQKGRLCGRRRFRLSRSARQQTTTKRLFFFFSPIATLPCVPWAASETNPTDGDDQRHCYWRHLLMQASCFTLILMHHVDSSTERAAPSSDGEAWL